MGITEAVMYADGLTKPKRKRRLSPARGYAAAISDAVLMLKVIDTAIITGTRIMAGSPCHKRIQKIRRSLRHNEKGQP